MTTTSPPRVTPTPQIGAKSSFTKRAVWLEITGPDDLRVSRSYGTQEFRPKAVQLEWSNDDDSPDWKLTCAQVIGRVLRQDGTVGKVPASRNFAAPGDRVSDAPDWLIKLCLDHGPFAPPVTVVKP